MFAWMIEGWLALFCLRALARLPGPIGRRARAFFADVDERQRLAAVRAQRRRMQG
jgi:hypothetical protein